MAGQPTLFVFQECVHLVKDALGEREREGERESRRESPQPFTMAKFKWGYRSIPGAKLRAKRHALIGQTVNNLPASNGERSESDSPKKLCAG